MGSFARAIKAVVLTTVVGGFLGWQVAHYLDRARPKLAVTSVGFHGPLESKPIELPDEITGMAEASQFVPTLNRYETYAKLLKVENTAAEDLEVLKLAVAATSTWITQHDLGSGNGSAAEQPLGINVLESCPIIRDEVVGRVLLSHLTRGELHPPTSMDQLAKLKPIEPLFTTIEDGREIGNLRVGMRVIRIRRPNRDDPARDGVELYLTSLSRGSTVNFGYYGREFISEAQKEIFTLGSFQQRVREILLPESHLTVRASIHNSGGSPAIIKPYFVLAFLHQDLSKQPYILAQDRPRDTEHNPVSLDPHGFSVSMPPDEEEGKPVYVRPFLPESSPSAYLSVAPGEVKEMTLVSIDALGANAERVKRVHETGLLSFIVTGHTANGVEITSDPAEFSQDIDKDERANLVGNR